MRAGVFDVGIQYPGKHLLALRQHLLRGCIEIRENFDRDSGIADERRNLLHDVFVFFVLFLPVQGTP